MRRHNNNAAVAIALVLFAAAIIKIPVGVGHGRELALGLFQSGVLIVFFILLWKINKWVSFFLILVVMSRTMSLTFQSQNAMTCVIFGLGWYYFVSEYGDKELLMDAMCVIAFANFLAVVVQFFKIPSVFTHTVVGLTYNPNACSAMLALCFPAFLRDGRKKFIWIPIMGLIMTPSFNGVLAVAVGMIFYAVMFNYYLIIPVIIAVVLFFLFCDKPGAGARWETWKSALDMIFTQKIIAADGKIYSVPFSWKWGCGIGVWKIVSQKFVALDIHMLKGNNLAWTRLHNSFLNGFVEMGVGFIAIVTGYLATQLKRYKQTIPFMALLIIIVCSSTNSMFRMNATNAMIAITWLSILEIEGGTYGEI